MKSDHRRILIGGVVILLLSLACSFSGISSTTGNPIQAITEESPDEITTDTLSKGEVWAMATLTLRSVTLELTTTYAEPKTISVQIDAVGNLHVSTAMPKLQGTAETTEFPQPGDFELFQINGTTYTRIGPENLVNPDDTNQPFLEDLLFGPEGPGMWLGLVPEDGFVKSGTESYGGFDVSIYTVNYQNEQGTLTGTIRVDNQSEALVSAELSISESLFFPPGSDPGGDVKISLSVQHTEVSPISLP
jgi:hypothetical protein